MLNAFKLKGFDLEPVYAEWKDGPTFTGDPKRDKPVDEWLEEIKAGCKARNVPKECWHKVGQHFMGEKARARLDELKSVMAKVNGGSYRWTWEKFKIAMRNMGWNIDASQTETIKVEAKSTGQWWFSRKNGQREEMDAAALSPVVESPVTEKALPPAPWTLRRAVTSKLSFDKGESKPAAPPPPASERKPRRRQTDMPPPSAFDSGKKPRRASSQTRGDCSKCGSCGSQAGGKLKRANSVQGERSSKDDSTRRSKSHREPRPAPAHSKSEMLPRETQRKERPKPSKLNSDTAVVAPAPTAPTDADETAVATGNAPTWLINACNALEFLQEEHPKAMSTLGAILITVGTIPAIPALHIGAGGAFLASGAVQAAGAIAVGVGKILTAAGKGTPPAQPTVEGKENVGKITEA